MSHVTQKRRYQLRRRRERIDLLRAMLIEKLGRRCATFGCPTPFDALEIDHVEGATWDRAAAGREGRHLRYMREYRAGVPLQLLCRHCNAVKNQHGLRQAWADFWRWVRDLKSSGAVAERGIPARGELAEWSKAPDSKSGRPATVS